MKIDLRTIPDAEVSGIDLMDVDITLPAPEAEPQRQYYFMALLKQQLVPERAKKNGKEFLTACITTFGCQMNARDSEKLEGILETVGYHIVETEDADFVVYNTCTVRENANLRVYGRLGQLGKYKKKNPGMIISLCGCMMQEPLVVEKLKKSYHFVNLIFGTHNIYRFAEYLVRCMTEDRMVIDIWKDTDKIVENLPEISVQIRRQYHVRLQQLLQLLYRTVCARPRAQPEAGGNRCRDQTPRCRRRCGDHAARSERQLLRKESRGADDVCPASARG